MIIVIRITYHENLTIFKQKAQSLGIVLNNTVSTKHSGKINKSDGEIIELWSARDAYRGNENTHHCTCPYPGVLKVASRSTFSQ